MGGDPTKYSEPEESRTGGNRDLNQDLSFRQSEVEFWSDRGERNNGGNGSFAYAQGWQPGEESPTWKRMNDHLMNRSNEITLEMGLDLDELKRDPSSTLNSRKVSFETSGVSFNTQTQQKDGGINDQTDDQSRHISNVSAPLFGKSGLRPALKSTKSRLIDRSEEEAQLMSGLLEKSGQLKSGMLGKASENEEEDDPFTDDVLPDKFRRTNLNAFTWVQIVSLFVIVAALLCSLFIPSLKVIDLWELELWKWLVFLLVLICGRLVLGWGIRILVFFIEMNFFLRKRMYFVYGLRKPVQNCLWLALVLLAWRFLFDKEVERTSVLLQYVSEILICLLVSSFLWLLKTLLVKVLASSFHLSTYFDRIQDTLFNQYVIATLSGSPVIEVQRMEEKDERTAAEIRRLQNAGATVPSDLRDNAFPQQTSGVLKKTLTRLKTLTQQDTSKKEDVGIALEHVHKLNQENISAWNMKRLMKMVRYGTLTTLDKQVMEHDSVKQIRSEHEATAAAKKIFHNVARPGSKFIYLEDLMRFMREDEALRTMATFEDAYEHGRISKKSLKNWVLNAYRERKALALTLNDTKTAVNKLHNIINVIVGIIILIIWVVVLEIASSELIALLSSQLLLAAFIFGNTCRTIFESIIFLFVIHPFDVGDRCEINGVQLVVEEMNILTTVFLRNDNMKTTFPNSVLSTTPIGNYYRSPDMIDLIEFAVHVATPVEKIALVKQRIINYIVNRKDHWCADPLIVIKDLDDLSRIKFSLLATHKMNFHDMGERLERRSRLAEEMVNIFKELDIEYRLLPVAVNICNLPNSSRFPSTWTAAESSDKID